MPPAPRAPIPVTLLLGASLALLGASTPQSAPSLDLDLVLQRVGSYVEQYQQDFSRLVCEERNTQEVREVRPVLSSAGVPSFALSSSSRRFVSEFALVLVEQGDTWMWLGFRDVIEVEGQPVRTERNRLEALFSSSPADLLARARAIADEGARYNLGQYRTINVPTLALKYFDRRFQVRQRYEKQGEEDVSGVRTWRVAFEELARPTVIRSPEGDDVPGKGIAWVDPRTGCIVRTQLEPQHRQRSETIVAPAPEALLQRSKIVVTYASDPRFGIWVPVKMEESHTSDHMTVMGKATYSKFRRFETTVRIKNENDR